MPSKAAYAPACSIQAAPLSGNRRPRAAANWTHAYPSARSRRRDSERSENSMMTEHRSLRPPVRQRRVQSFAGRKPCPPPGECWCRVAPRGRPVAVVVAAMRSIEMGPTKNPGLALTLIARKGRLRMGSGCCCSECTCQRNIFRRKTGPPRCRVRSSVPPLDFGVGKHFVKRPENSMNTTRSNDAQCAHHRARKHARGAARRQVAEGAERAAHDRRQGDSKRENALQQREQ